MADLLPDWGVTTHVEPRPEHVEMLPFLANNLATVRTPETTPRTRATAQAEAADAFFRSGEARGDGGTRSYVRPESTDALEQVWVGEGVPVGASKGLPEAYHNRLERSAAEGDIDITVVCNSRAMATESAVVDETYGSGVDLPFDVTVRERLTRAELRETLASDGDFLHYVGHIDARGFDCADGWLDAETVEHVGVDAFLLNACQSFEQGAALVRAGAVAGLVTLGDVVNDAAVRMGCLLARLLNYGFPLTGALDLAGDVRPIGDQYTVVGDGTLTLARADGSPPLGPVVAALDEETYELELKIYPTRRLTTGSLISPCVPGCDEQYLFSHHVDTFELDGDDLAQWLQHGPMPVRTDGGLWWSDEIDLDSL